MPSNRRASRMFQEMRGGTVCKELAGPLYTDTSMITSYQAIKKTNMEIPDIYLIRVAFQSMGNLEPRALGAGTTCIKQCKKPASRKLGGD